MRPFVLLLVLAGLGARADAQLLYNTLGGPAGSALRQLTPTGPIPLTVGGLLHAEAPTLSRSGRLLGVTAGSGNQISQNVFRVDAATSQLQQITNFQDFAHPITGDATTHLPLHKAFSPDASQVAVTDFELISLNPLFNPNQSFGLSGLGRTPVNYIFNVADGSLARSIGRGPPRDGTHTSSDGIDWSPVADRIITPLLTNVPRSDGSGLPGAVTALFSTNSFGEDVRQVTFPRANSIGFGASTQLFGENDLLPQFSPNGQAIAYFRVLDTLLGTGGRAAAVSSLRITSPNGDRAVLEFPPGQYPTGLAWSPDGTQLAYSIGQQAVVDGLPALFANLTTSELFTVNVDGTNAQRVAPAPAFRPAWSALGSNNPPTADLNGDGIVSVADLSPINGLFSVGDLVNGVPTPPGRERWDLRPDGRVDGADLQEWLRLAGATLGRSGPFLAGDTDLNGTVEFADFLTFADQFGTGRGWTEGNFDGSADGTQFPDFLALSANFGREAALPYAGVPEPTLALHAVLTIALLLGRRRSRNV